jgi:hypothetical protein
MFREDANSNRMGPMAPFVSTLVMVNLSEIVFFERTFLVESMDKIK